MISLILESAARTLLLTAAVWTALRLLRVGNVIAQKIAWALVLAAAIAMPFLMRLRLIQVSAVPSPAILSSWTNPVHGDVHAASAASAIPAPEEAKEPVSSTVSLAPATFEIAPAVAANTLPTRRWTLPALKTLVVRIYLVVSGFLLLRLLFGLALAWRIWSRAEPASVLVEPHADVRFSSDIRTPVTIGLGIVLPASFLDWSRPRLRIVLAHELAHVRQRDFYLQILAHLHTAVFWFSPAGWWIQKHLSDLGEAISDFAGITEAKDAPSYAELLLEVAALPRQPLFAVAMARSSRIEHRIDRLLVDRLFRRSFVEGKGRALAVAAIVPLVLTASTSLVAVRAAEKMTAPTTPFIHVVAQDSNVAVAVPDTPAPAPKLPVAKLPNVKLETAVPEQPAIKALPAPLVAQANPPAVRVEHDPDTYYSDSDQDSFMIVNGDKSQMFNFHGDYAVMEALRKKLHGNYILAERSGKNYVIDDPALMEQTRQLFAPMEELGRQQEALGAQQEKLGEEQARLGKLQEQAHIDTPDMSKEIAELQEAVKQLQDLEKNKTVTQGDLASVQGRIGSIEGRMGEMQGRIGSQEGELGRQQGELGAKQGALGAQQGKLGAEQGRIARRASRQMKSMIDQAFQSGKAKPVD
jgi:beta-lactamase regulating signal transducer with metallopeptidase domain